MQDLPAVILNFGKVLNLNHFTISANALSWVRFCAVNHEGASLPSVIFLSWICKGDLCRDYLNYTKTVSLASSHPHGFAATYLYVEGTLQMSHIGQIDSIVTTFVSKILKEFL